VWRCEEEDYKKTEEKECSTFIIKNVHKENDNNSRKYIVPLLPL
jgi:hypothetical protein